MTANHLGNLNWQPFHNQFAFLECLQQVLPGVTESCMSCASCVSCAPLLSHTEARRLELTDTCSRSVDVFGVTFTPCNWESVLSDRENTNLTQNVLKVDICKSTDPGPVFHTILFFL